MSYFKGPLAMYMYHISTKSLEEVLIEEWVSIVENLSNRAHFTQNTHYTLCTLSMISWSIIAIPFRTQLKIWMVKRKDCTETFK